MKDVLEETIVGLRPRPPIPRNNVKPLPSSDVGGEPTTHNPPRRKKRTPQTDLNFSIVDCKRGNHSTEKGPANR